jgi:cellulose synthase/poly-beta-1,6-N-acetylglucosamine synthase-like glycosyltransferase
MFLALFITLALAVGIATVALVTIGHRVRFSSRLVAITAGCALAVVSGEVVARVGRFAAEPVLGAEIAIAAATVLVALTRPRWNPVGQVFFATFLAAAISYVVFAVTITFTGLGVIGMVASTLLLGLEVFALTLAGYFVYEGCDIICRVRPTRPEPRFDPSYLPKVSLQVPAYNEPPELLIETIKSLDAIDYPNLEIVVIDNNTPEKELWEPVAAFCESRDRVKFVHRDNVPGFKAGALNLVMREVMDQDVEIIGIVDADYAVDPSFLKELVGYFADPNIAFVQTPQDYREWQGDTYLTACYDAYRYFFVTTMPARDQRNSIIFAGTMGLIRRSALDEIGGWPEWCITEDAETSFRILKNGHSGLFVPKMYGNGIMPLTFSAFKGQRFRWAFGGIQILRKHFRSMLPGPRTRKNRLGLAQRLDYLMSGVMWFNDVLHLGFAAVLVATAFIVLTRGSIELRPLRGAIILLPAALIVSGVVRALWSLRVRAQISMKRGMFAFLNWLSCSWVTALACIQHLFKKDAAFLRTPKEGTERSIWAALRAARAETALAVVIWGLGIAVVATGRATAFLVVLFAWQGLVYGAAPLMSWLNVRSEMSAELQQRRETEYTRARIGRLAPFYAGAAALIIVMAGVFAVGGSQPVDPEARGRLFAAPPREQDGGRSPLSSLGRTISEGLDEISPVSSGPTPASTTGPDTDDGDVPEATDEPAEAPAPTEAPTDAPADEATAEPTTEPTTAPTQQPATEPPDQSAAPAAPAAP